MANAPRQPDLLTPPEAGDHVQGPEDAPVTLVEYGDYECPYCARAFPIIRRLRAEMPDKLRFVFRHFPLNSVHPHASVAAQAAEAAGAQGKFWDMHDLLFEHQEDLEASDLQRYAIRAGVEIYRFQADLSSERFARKVKRDYESGVASGVKGTPTLFVNGVKYAGPLEYDALADAIRLAANVK
jgi:Na+:H+ antiporter, NhaA family